MHKTFTHNFFIYFLRITLIAVTIAAASLTQPITAGYGTISSDIQLKTVKCYPNPAISFITFEFPSDYISKDYTLQVYSFTGKKVYELGVTSVKVTLTFTNEFYRGIYVYQLRNKDGKILETSKFQVNR